MSVDNLYRSGIYRIKARKQPPSRVLLVLALALLALAVALAFAVASVRPFPVELELSRALQSLFAASPLRPLLDAERQWVGALVVGALGIVVMLVTRHWSDARFFALTILVADGALETLKNVFARPRPSADLIQVFDTRSTFSFPSVHVGLALIGAGLLSYLVVRAYRKRALNETLDQVALGVVLGACALLVVVSSLAALVSGAHWATDVLGSYLFGGAYTIGAILLRRQWLKWRGTDKMS